MFQSKQMPRAKINNKRFVKNEVSLPLFEYAV